MQDFTRVAPQGVPPPPPCSLAPLGAFLWRAVFPFGPCFRVLSKMFFCEFLCWCPPLAPPLPTLFAAASEVAPAEVAGEILCTNCSGEKTCDTHGKEFMLYKVSVLLSTSVSVFVLLWTTPLFAVRCPSPVSLLL